MPDSLKTKFLNDGYFIVEQILSGQECETLKSVALGLLAEDQKSVLVPVSTRSEVFRRLSEDPRVLGYIEPLFNDGVTFQSDKFVYKNGQQRFATPWHTDNQYWANRRPKLSAWIPLDDVSESNGTLKVIPGSHLKQWPTISSAGEDANGEFRNRIDPQAIPQADAVACEVPAGSLVIFSDALLHASTPNVSGRDRYAVISTYHETRIPDPEPKGPATRILTGA